MNNLNYIIFTILFLLVLNLYMGKKTESMTNIDDNQKTKIKQMIYDTYKDDVKTIKNLSDISNKLQKEGLTIPGNLVVTGNIKSANIITTGDIKSANITKANEINTVDLKISGNINIKDTNTILLNSGNSLQIKTKDGKVDVGPQNADWCHIYTDRPYFTLDKQITHLSDSLTTDYMTVNDKAQLAGSIEDINKDFTKFKSYFDGYTLKPVCITCASKHGRSRIDYDTTCEKYTAQQYKNWGLDHYAFTALLYVKDQVNIE